MTGTRRGERTATRRRGLRAGVVLVGAAMCVGVAFTVTPAGAQTAEGTIRTAPLSEAGTIQRTGNVYVAPGVTAAATYVIVAPGGLLLGPDGTPIANVTPVTYVNGVASGPASGPAPVQTISTPTAVRDTLAGATIGNTGGISPGQHLIGSVDGPTNGGVPGLPPPVMSGQFVTMPPPVQTISTPTPVIGPAPAPFGGNGGNGATATPPFVQRISTPTAVGIPASFAGSPGVAGGDPTNTLAGTPGSTNAVSGVTFPGRGGTP